MKEDKNDIFRWIARLNRPVTLVAVLMILLVLQVRAITHYLYLDEYLHLHYLWLLSKGLIPHLDFWCAYPVLGYIVVLPLFRAFPESAYTILGMRFISCLILLAVGVIFAAHGHRVAKQWRWGFFPFALVFMTPELGGFFTEYSVDHLAGFSALAAITLMFGELSLAKLGLVVVLSVFSVIFTPKYIFLLSGTFTIYCVYFVRSLRRPLVLLSVVGGALLLTVGAVWCLYLAAGSSLWRNLYSAHLFISMHVLRQYPLPANPWEGVGRFLARHFFTGLLVAGGVFAWALSSFRRPKSAAWVGTGLLIGIAVSLLTADPRREQHIAPSILGLVVFVPFLFSVLERFKWSHLLTLLLLLSVIIMGIDRTYLWSKEYSRTVINYRDSNAEETKCRPKVRRGSFFQTLAALDTLLDLIPEDERVVGLWDHHPIFRMDLTYITFDEIPSYSNFIDPASTLYGYFQPEYFAEELAKNHPACIGLYQIRRNYPPGWAKVCLDFLNQHKEDYYPLTIGDIRVYVRRDLLMKKLSAFQGRDLS